MKINKRCKKGSAVLAVGAAMTPLATTAAPVGTNLVVNPGFENVNLSVTGRYSAPMILDWVGAVAGFAYSHDRSGANVPDYANGGPLAGGGHWYFTPGNGGNNSLANALTQDIDVSAGASGIAIASGSATYGLSAFFSTYATQADRAFIQADFLGAGNANLGTTQISSPVSPFLATWTLFSTSGTVPIGTQKVHLSSWGQIFVGSTGSPDGYTDNVSFVIVPEPSSAVLAAITLGYAIGVLRRRPPS